MRTAGTFFHTEQKFPAVHNPKQMFVSTPFYQSILIKTDFSLKNQREGIVCEKGIYTKYKQRKASKSPTCLPLSQMCGIVGQNTLGCARVM